MNIMKKMKRPKEKNLKCPKCKSRKIVYRGFRYNENSEKRLRLCKNCGRKFTEDDGFLRMRFDKKDILRAVQLKKRGYSLNDIKQELKSREGIDVSRWGISKWIRKYGK
jgi:transposase-like protein